MEFPFYFKIGYSKPVYFEDLDENNTQIIKKKILSNIELSKKFQNRFIFIQQIILSTTIGLISDYAIQKISLPNSCNSRSSWSSWWIIFLIC